MTVVAAVLVVVAAGTKKGWVAYSQWDKKYVVIAGPGLDAFAKRLEMLFPKKFIYMPTKWEKFEDGSDHIEVTALCKIFV